MQRTNTLSIGLAAFFGFASVLLLLNQEWIRRPDLKYRPCGYMLSLFCFLVALFSKESSSILLVMVATILFCVRAAPLQFDFRPTRRAALAFLPFLAAFGFYYWLRMQVGANPPAFGPGEYEFTLSATVGKNILSCCSPDVHRFQPWPPTSPTNKAPNSSRHSASCCLCVLPSSPSSVLCFLVNGEAGWPSQHGVD